jgi:hypothetical protein
MLSIAVGRSPSRPSRHDSINALGILGFLTNPKYNMIRKDMK